MRILILLLFLRRMNLESNILPAILKHEVTKKINIIASIILFGIFSIHLINPSLEGEK